MGHGVLRVIYTPYLLDELEETPPAGQGVHGDRQHHDHAEQEVADQHWHVLGVERVVAGVGLDDLQDDVGSAVGLAELAREEERKLEQELKHLRNGDHLLDARVVGSTHRRGSQEHVYDRVEREQGQRLHIALVHHVG